MRRWPLFAAIAYVVLLFIGLFLVPNAPEVTASGAKLVRFYRDHGNGIRVVAWLGTLSTIPIVLLLAQLRSRLTGPSRDVMLLGSAGLIITTRIHRSRRAHEPHARGRPVRRLGRRSRGREPCKCGSVIAT